MRKLIFLSILFLVVIYTYQSFEENIYIPNNAIRLRVIPNSNKPIDISIKEKVKTYLEQNIYDITKNINDVETARTIINSSIPKIETNIDKIFKENNYKESYQVNYGYNYFPQKVYKGTTYDEGYYESLIISIGEANGDNWWCVLFPNFCLIDSDNNKEYKSYIKEIFNKIKHNIN